MVASVLKKNFQGSEAWIISSDDPNATFSYTDPRTGRRKEGTPFDFIGLKPSLKIDLNNGGIPCQLRKYELFSGRYDDFRQEGGELDKQSADQKQDNTRFDRVRKDFGKKGSSFKKGDKPFKKDDKPFKKDGRKDGKADSGDRKKRFFDKDGKAYERGHKPADTDKPRRPHKDSNTQRTYTIGKDGSISVSRGNFKRGADGKLEERGGEHKPRGLRTYDPNRPMFGEDFDKSKVVLDYTKKPEKDQSDHSE